MLIFLLISSSILSAVTERFSNIKTLECAFVETLEIETWSIYFSGLVFISRDGSRIEVEEPDKQIIIFKEDSVFIYIEKDNRLDKTIAPMSLSRLIFSPLDYYNIDSTIAGWTYLSAKEDIFSYPLSVFFNEKYFPERIRFTQEGVEGRFRFFKYKINPDLPDGIFSTDSFL
ncbi:hypothetical protein ES703_47730 [subsurface metagenome]